MKEVFIEESLHEVLRYWADDYKNMGEVVDFSAYIDQAKGKVVFKLKIKEIID